MSSVLKAAWRVVARRAVADKAILLAVFFTVLLAIMLAAAAPIYADAVTISSLRRTLIDSPIEESGVAITTRVTPESYVSTDDEVFTAMNDAFSSIGGAIYRRGTSDSYSVTGLGEDLQQDLVVFRFFTDIQQHAELVSGSWPGESTDPVQVALSKEAARALDVGVGDVFVVEGRSHGSGSYSVQVAGIYQTIDVTDPFWLGDELDLNGILPSASFTTIGPLVVTSGSFFATVASGTSAVRWSALPNHQSILVEDIAPILGQLDSLEARLNSTRDMGNTMQIDTGLDAILRNTERSLLVTRSAVLILTIQLAVLSGYSLILAAGLLADTRDIETTTLRARGASNAQLLGMTVMEGSMLTLPAALIGPPLAALSLRLFNDVGPLAGIGLGIEPAVTGVSWALAAVAATGCVVALAVPAYRSARRSGSVRALRARQSSSSLTRRAGADIALLAIAGMGLWQLARYGAPITTTVQGRLGVDPLLVAAPALALLAGAVLALRALPLLARLGEGLVVRGRALVAALGIWHLGRQSRRYARSALMLILAIAIGVFALSYDATWQHSQSDRAGFATGADILVAPSRRAVASIPPSALPSTYLAAGAENWVPLVHLRDEISGSTLPVMLLMLDAARAADVIIFRPDQAPGLIGDQLSLLSTARPSPTTPVIPGDPVAVSVTAAFTIDPVGQEGAGLPPWDYDIAPTLRVVFTDADGIPFRVDLGSLDPSGQPVRLSGDIAYRDEDDRRHLPTYPLRLEGLELKSSAPIDPVNRTAELKVTGVEFSANGSVWEPFPLPGTGQLTSSVSAIRLEGESPRLDLESGPSGDIVAHLLTGTSFARPSRPATYFMIRTATPAEISEIPVLAASGLLDDLGLQVGDPIPLGGLTGYQGSGKVVGRFDSFPTVDPTVENGVVVDYATYLAATFGPGVFPSEPDDFMLSASNEELEPIAQQLRNKPIASTSVVTREEALTRLSLDPVSLGTIGSLILGLAAAAILAAIGFLVNVVVTTRERQSQFALMRAVGMSRRQLLAWVGVETGVTVGFALLFGTGLGLVLTNIVLPLTTITQQATVVVPPLVVVHPWVRIFLLEAGVVATLVIGLLIVARMLRRLNLAALLRAGEE